MINFLNKKIMKKNNTYLNLLNKQLVLFITLFLASCSSAISSSSEKQTLGWVEKVSIGSMDFYAKLDASSELSSINAEDIKRYKKGNKRYVRFKLVDRSGKTKAYKKRIVRIAKIKNSRGKIHKRVIVRFPICLGNTLIEEEVALADRSHLDYEMLVGRSFLSGNSIIDPSKTFSAEPSCR